MARQYGSAPEDPKASTSKSGGYTKPTERKDAPPPPKDTDPSPPAEAVRRFHENAQVDTRKEDIHHTIGTTANHASAGNHTHKGGDSVQLLGGVVLTGSRGGNAALLSVVQALVALGAKDSTAP